MEMSSLVKLSRVLWELRGCGDGLLGGAREGFPEEQKEGSRARAVLMRKRRGKSFRLKYWVCKNTRRGERTSTRVSITSWSSTATE